MARKDQRVRQWLEKRAAWGGVKILIPSALLPPRYQKIGRNHDMFLVMDDLQRLRIRWDGQRLEEYHPLTPRQAVNLITKVIERMAQYRIDLQTFSQFVDDTGERPPEDECPLDVPWRSAKIKELEEGAAQKTALQRLAERLAEEEAAKSQDVVAVIHTTPPSDEEELGGESPMGPLDMGI